MKNILVLIITVFALASCSVTEPMENGQYTESRFIPAQPYSVYDPLYDPYYNDSRYGQASTYYSNGRYYTRPAYQRPAYSGRPVYTRPAYPVQRPTYTTPRQYNGERSPRHERRTNPQNDTRQNRPAVLDRNAPWKS